MNAFGHSVNHGQPSGETKAGHISLGKRMSTRSARRTKRLDISASRKRSRSPDVLPVQCSKRRRSPISSTPPEPSFQALPRDDSPSSLKQDMTFDSTIVPSSSQSSVELSALNVSKKRRTSAASKPVSSSKRRRRDTDTNLEQRVWHQMLHKDDLAIRAAELVSLVTNLSSREIITILSEDVRILVREMVDNRARDEGTAIDEEETERVVKRLVQRWRRRLLRDHAEGRDVSGSSWIQDVDVGGDEASVDNFVKMRKEITKCRSCSDQLYHLTTKFAEHLILAAPPSSPSSSTAGSM